jgi:anaerobic selenocysteine-containing dehydrogenase
MLEELARLRAQIAEAAPAGSLALIGRREIRSNNSWMHNAPRLIKGKQRHHLLMHPDDLSTRGIEDGARVRVRSRTGSIETDVRASDAIMRGVACLPHGFGHARDGVRIARAQGVAGESYNDLSDAGLLDVPSGNAALSGVPVWVEAIT